MTTQYTGFSTEYLSFRCVTVGKRKYIVVPEGLDLHVVVEGGDFIEVKQS